MPDKIRAVARTRPMFLYESDWRSESSFPNLIHRNQSINCNNSSPASDNDFFSHRPSLTLRKTRCKRILPCAPQHWHVVTSIFLPWSVQRWLLNLKKYITRLDDGEWTVDLYSEASAGTHLLDVLAPEQEFDCLTLPSNDKSKSSPYLNYRMIVDWCTYMACSARYSLISLVHPYLSAFAERCKFRSTPDRFLLISQIYAASERQKIGRRWIIDRIEKQTEREREKRHA